MMSPTNLPKRSCANDTTIANVPFHLILKDFLIGWHVPQSPLNMIVPSTTSNATYKKPLELHHILC